jgi:hypothetical protein
MKNRKREMRRTPTGRRKDTERSEEHQPDEGKEQRDQKNTKRMKNRNREARRTPNGRRTGTGRREEYQTDEE